jgi:dGTPase
MKAGEHTPEDALGTYIPTPEWACQNSTGRPVPEPPDGVRNEFQRDRDRIIHAKAFRRLMHKTQVFISPDGDHFRTRLTHTLEMMQISRTIARSLGLNEDLAEAITLGHDLGHTPFGHVGEEALARVLVSHRRGFRHNEHSLRVVDVLEKGGKGLNLTHEVRDGILNHTGKGYPATREGEIVRIADRIAYVNHDVDDALRAGVISWGDLPQEPLKILGDRMSVRIDTMVRDMILTSRERREILLSEKVYGALIELRTWLFKNVYHNPRSRENRKA